MVICLVGCAITWPVLFPVNATGGGTAKELNILTLSNVTDNYYSTSRRVVPSHALLPQGYIPRPHFSVLTTLTEYFAHAGCAIIFFSFVIYMITRESIYFINLRQAYLMSPFYTSRISSRTVLFTSVPEDYMDERWVSK